MIYLDEDSLHIVKLILQSVIPNRTVIVFGSRVKGNCKPFSDLDLCVMGNPLPAKTFISLKEAFSESNLPIRVDIVEWMNVSSEFQEIIKQCSEVLQNR